MYNYSIQFTSLARATARALARVTTRALAVKESSMHIYVYRFSPHCKPSPSVVGQHGCSYYWRSHQWYRSLCSYPLYKVDQVASQLEPISKLSYKAICMTITSLPHNIYLAIIM